VHIGKLQQQHAGLKSHLHSVKRKAQKIQIRLASYPWNGVFPAVQTFGKAKTICEPGVVPPFSFSRKLTLWNSFESTDNLFCFPQHFKCSSLKWYFSVNLVRSV
jgi:hypothetical protein